MNTMIDIEKLLNWSAPKRVRTSKGERDLLKAQPTAQFSALWKSNKPELQELGLGWGKENDGSWIVMWWKQPADAAEKAESLAASKAVDADIALPVNDGLAYLGYQKAGIAYALAHEGALIGDEMGLGKTIQAIGVINADPSIQSVLIVCPASIKLNWARELRKWLTRPLTIQLVGSGANWGKADITIINFEMLAKFELSIVGRKFDLAIIDESHRVKNPKAQVTKTFVKIEAARRIAMTGTPILNRPVEMFTTLAWLDPQRWGGKWWTFVKRYCGAFQQSVGYGKLVWNVDGASNLAELQEVLRTSVMVRRLKKDVLKDLPAKVRSVVELEPDANAKRAAQAELEKWEEFEALRQAALEAKAEAEAANDQAAYEAAVEALEEANAVAFESMSKVRHETAVAKLPMVLEFVEEILEDSTEKLVIFAHHQDVVDGLMEGLAEFNPVKLVGGMSPKAKQESIDRFQNEAAVRVFVGSTRAAGVGITLTAASHVVFAELDWTPGIVSQAEDRCHRIGQHDSVQVQHLVLEGSLDAMMAQMIVDKQRIADAALDKEGRKIEVKVQKTEVKVLTGADAPKPALSDEQAAAAHQAMKYLASICDGALSEDMHGFNKLDTAFGKSLAAQHTLSEKQALIAARLANKYRRQLPKEVLEAIKGEGQG